MTNITKLIKVLGSYPKSILQESIRKSIQLRMGMPLKLTAQNGKFTMGMR